LHPIIEQLERAAGFGRDDSTARKLDKMEALLRQSVMPRRRVMTSPSGFRLPRL